MTGPAEILLARLGGVRSAGEGKWMALCPAHADRNPSLSITEKPNGNVLVHCHAGCEVAAVLAVIGLETRGLFAESTNGGGRDVEAVYRYVDEDGRPLFEVVRRADKQFAQRKPNGGGWGIAGVRRVLYRLPNVVAAVAAGDVVYVVEGEKDVHALEGAGVVATCNPGGAGKWRADYSSSLRGAKVIVVADKDRKGYDHAREVAESLAGVAASVGVVELPRGKDAHAHLAAGGTIDERVEIADSGSHKDPPFPQAADDEPGAGASSVDAILRALFEDPQKTEDATGPAREEVPGSGGLCHRDHAMLLFSERGQGKTTVALVAGLSVAAAGGTVFYFDRENGAALTRARVESILDAHDGWPDVLATGRFVGRHYPALGKGWEPESYGEAIASRAITLVIYDSLREAISQLGGDPNSDADISRFIDLAVTPLVRRGISVMVLDNTGHENTDRPKGSGSKLDAIPQAYKVVTTERFSPAELGRIELTCTRSRFGDEGRHWTMRAGQGVFDVPEARDESPDLEAAREIREKQERLRQAAIAALREQSPLGRNALIAQCRTRGVKGKNTRLRNWLAELAADPTSGLVSSDTEGYSLAADPHGPAEKGHGGATPPEGPPAPDPLPTEGGGSRGHPGPDDGGRGTAEHRDGDQINFANDAEPCCSCYPKPTRRAGEDVCRYCEQQVEDPAAKTGDR